MPTISKAIVDADLRRQVFDKIFANEITDFHKVNDRQYGALLTDMNGVERYVRIGAIVAEERTDMSARELMDSEIDRYEAAQEKKAEQKRKNAEKAKADAEKRAARVKAKEDKE